MAWSIAQDVGMGFGMEMGGMVVHRWLSFPFMLPRSGNP
jgi:hypothetical protein